ncbi:hypothetical protein [Cellulophaga baltica]|uniref:hypothetical protein n=1 Tax=Cellulophaga baltica TaxID=76594 RepID=UPI002495A39E|nr:hypothetical protein [Cellulophaga baltica]
MIDLSHAEHQIRCVTNFEDLISMPFNGKFNAACWTRELVGDFSEIIQQIELHENIAEINQEELRELVLSDQGQLAREILLNDLQTLKNLGASPVLNLIKCYERDDAYPFFPTDVYSFHVDRSPIPTDTFLCTYHGDSSDLIPNSQAIQKVLVPEIREELRKLYGGADEGFEAFLSEYFFDLHYQPKPEAPIINLGIGHLWKLAVDHPESKSLPCIHRAPNEITGQHRLLLIC